MISITAAGGYDCMVYSELTDGKPTRGANITEEGSLVTVKTVACGINYAEVCIRYGVYKSATELVGYPITPGFECSGIVTSVGSDVKKFKVGDSVFGCTLFGGYSELVKIPENQLFHVPKGLTMSEAGCFPAVAVTAWFAICECCRIRPGYPILIHSVAGGVGSMLAQIGKILGCKVVGVVGRTEKVQYAKDLGCDAVIDKSASNLWTEAEVHSPSGYRVIFDANGIETLSDGYKHLSPGGRLVSYGFHTMIPKSTENSTGKAGISNMLRMGYNYLKTPSFSPLDMCSANKSVMSFNLSFMFDEVEMLEEAMTQLLGWVAEGKLKVPKVTEYALKDAGKAHRDLESGKTTGKLALMNIENDKETKQKEVEK